MISACKVVKLESLCKLLVYIIDLTLVESYKSLLNIKRSLKNYYDVYA